MAHPQWQPDWLQTHACEINAPMVWRGVESQYASATLPLVDSLSEHDVLEQLLERSKPALPPHPSASKHFLLTTPFRYSPVHASRFRKAGGHGIWYGAPELKTACCEVAYWRMRFILDSAGLQQSNITTTHTFFAASVHTHKGIDLMQAPWLSCRQAWTSQAYTETHKLAEACLDTSLEVINYESARAPGQACLAVLTPDALSEPTGSLDATRDEWVCVAWKDQVIMKQKYGRGQYEFIG